MKIFTSCYENIDAIRAADPSATFVAVSGGVPEWYGARPDERWMRSLAPKWAWRSEWHGAFKGRESSSESVEWYAEKYASTTLAGRDPLAVAAEIGEVAGGGNAYLLCFERPGEFCHRRLLAEWLTGAGVDVQEFGESER